MSIFRKLDLDELDRYAVLAKAELNQMKAAGVPAAQLKPEREVLAEAERIGMIKDRANWEPRAGVRVKSAPAAILGGMHRTGYALAPALAERIIARVGR